MITAFEPLTPNDRYNTDNDRLNHLMREVDLPPDETDNDDLAAWLSGVTFTAGLLDGLLLAGPIADA